MTVRILDWVAMRRMSLLLLPIVVLIYSISQYLYGGWTHDSYWKHGSAMTVIGMLVGWAGSSLMRRTVGRNLHCFSDRGRGMYYWPRHWFRDTAEKDALSSKRVQEWCEKHKQPFVVWYGDAQGQPRRPMWYGFETEDLMMLCRMSV